MKNQAQQAMGKAKEWVGDKSHNEQMQAEGQRDQESSKMKQQAGGQNMQNKDMQDKNMQNKDMQDKNMQQSGQDMMGGS
jgi:uncharacterized protein YjbJ (UPF0337 family)